MAEKFKKQTSGLPALTDRDQFLLEMRDRSLSRFFSYDLTVLTILFGIAVAWGAIASITEENAEHKYLVEMFLAVGGFVISIA